MFGCILRFVLRVLASLLTVGALAATAAHAQAPAGPVSPVRPLPWTSPTPPAPVVRPYTAIRPYSPGQLYAAPAPVYGYNTYTVGSAPTIAGYRYLDDYATGRHVPLAKPWARPLR